MHKIKQNSGFTLVELSIVIVIIGLIVAGVVGGQALVRQAQLRSVVVDVNNYKIAINTFKLEYNQLPGDFDNAFAYWNTQCASNAERCNGDGNKIISNSGSGGANNKVEAFRAWQHLQLSEILETGLIDPYIGNYAASSWPAPWCINANHSVRGFNNPSSKIINGTFGLIYSDPTTSSISQHILVVDKPFQHHIYFGRDRAQCRRASIDAVISPKESFAIDSKIDDGTPFQGAVKDLNTVAYVTPNCRTGAGASAEYNLSFNDIACSLLFEL